MIDRPCTGTNPYTPTLARAVFVLTRCRVVVTRNRGATETGQNAESQLLADGHFIYGKHPIMQVEYFSFRRIIQGRPENAVFSGGYGSEFCVTIVFTTAQQ